MEIAQNFHSGCFDCGGAFQTVAVKMKRNEYFTFQMIIGITGARFLLMQYV